MIQHEAQSMESVEALTEVEADRRRMEIGPFSPLHKSQK